MWKPKGSRPSVSQETEKETLLRSPSSTGENSSISHDLGNLSLAHGGTESEETLSGAGSPTKERSDVGATSLSGKDPKKSGNGETRRVMIEVQPGGDYKKTVKKRPKHGHDRSQVSLNLLLLFLVRIS